MAAHHSKRKTRDPQQRRSIDKKEKILRAAYAVFCAKGFYRSTTTEIARKAGVSIGALYSYFKDKEDLFMVILERYMEQFEAARDRMLQASGDKDPPLPDIARSILTALIIEHEASKELNREIGRLSYEYPEVAARMEHQQNGVRQSIADYLRAHRKALRVDDIEAATMVVWQLIDGLVHHIVFGAAATEKDRLVEAGVDALSSYLIKAAR